MATTKKGWLKTPHGDNFIPKTYATEVYMSDGKTTVQDKLNNYTGGSNSGGTTSGSDKYHTTGSWKNLTYTATSNGGAGELKFTLPEEVATQTWVENQGFAKTSDIPQGGGTGGNTNYYHVPTYTSGIKIGTGAGIADLYVPTGTTANSVATGSHNHDDKYAKISQIAEVTGNYYNMHCWHRKGSIVDVDYYDSKFEGDPGKNYVDIFTNYHSTPSYDMWFSTNLDSVARKLSTATHVTLNHRVRDMVNGSTTITNSDFYFSVSGLSGVSTSAELVSYLQNLINQLDTDDDEELYIGYSMKGLSGDNTPSVYAFTNPEGISVVTETLNITSTPIYQECIRFTSGKCSKVYLTSSTIDQIVYNANKNAYTSNTSYTENTEDGLQYKYLGVPKEFVPRKLFNIT